MDGLTLHQTAFALLISLVSFGLILELVRRRRLREESPRGCGSLTAAIMVLLVVWFPLLRVVTVVIGAATPINTLLLFAVLFLFAIAVHYSVIISRLTSQVKNLAQELALVSARVDDRTDSQRHASHSAGNRSCWLIAVQRASARLARRLARSAAGIARSPSSARAAAIARSARDR